MTSWTISHWNPGPFTTTLLGSSLSTENDASANTCKLSWSNSSGVSCSMTLTGNLPDTLTGTNISVEGLQNPLIVGSITCSTTINSSSQTLNGTLSQDTTERTAPGTFAATSDPGPDTCKS
jgi:hypothetical protein